jgi:hypothetical protein
LFFLPMRRPASRRDVAAMPLTRFSLARR